MVVEKKVEVFCRMPEDRKKKMAQCSRCKDWFHESCQKIPAAVFKSRGRALCVSDGFLLVWSVLRTVYSPSLLV